ncbi:serotriflin [Lingula anatina]|uniref:Serotriflin n=1 Tax=Lingula anatina TaxID=7574 RepID=A0A1S3IH93_LINAN|nr:serotriflin [Lingula anatina]|eukprot:XP_013397582.1 serotriflin [Lingula anatina]
MQKKVAGVLFVIAAFGVLKLDAAAKLPWQVYKRTSSGYTTREEAAILKRHNEMRRSVSPSASNMRSMVWDNDLALIAKRWANKCEWRHGNIKQGTPYANDYLGQNLYSSTHPPSTTVEPMNSWFAEKKDYSYARDTCKPGEICGHYTQLVWANSYRLGCAFKECRRNSPFGTSKWYYSVCNYYPGGNIIGRKPYKTGRPCSKCAAQGNTGDCVQGLCATTYQCDREPESCGLENTCGRVIECDNGGTPDYDTCGCRCPPAYGGRTCRAAKCSAVYKCQNGGKFDYDSCTCQCTEFFAGRTCERAKCSELGQSGKDVYWCSTVGPEWCQPGFHLVGEPEDQEIRYKYCPRKCGIC